MIEKGRVRLRKILEFGIAKVLHRDERRPGRRWPAPCSDNHVLSPEAARGEEGDHRAASTRPRDPLRHLTGRPPFYASAAAEVLAMQINYSPSPREIAPHLEITEAADRSPQACRGETSGTIRLTRPRRAKRCYGAVYKRHTSLPGLRRAAPRRAASP